MKTKRGGFTLIELSLSMIFIGILSITVVLLIQNLTASYRRGLVLNEINTIGMDLTDDFRISVQNASSDPVTRMCEIYYDYNSTNRQNCVSDNAESFVSVTKMANVSVNGRNLGSMPVYGAFCTGTYTYVWNSGYFESTDTETRVVSTNPVVVGTRSATGAFTQKYDNFRLLKIYDDERSICVNAMKAQDPMGSGNYIRTSDTSKYSNGRVPNQLVISEAMIDENETDAVELLKRNDVSDLVIYDLYVAKPALSSTRKNLFYAAQFILGTRRGGINITEAGNSCKPPSDEYSELEYCAINKFNFAVQAGGA